MIAGRIVVFNKLNSKICPAFFQSGKLVEDFQVGLKERVGLGKGGGVVLECRTVKNLQACAVRLGDIGDNRSNLDIVPVGVFDRYDVVIVKLRSRGIATVGEPATVGDQGGGTEGKVQLLSPDIVFVDQGSTPPLQHLRLEQIGENQGVVAADQLGPLVAEKRVRGQNAGTGELGQGGHKGRIGAALAAPEHDLANPPAGQFGGGRRQGPCIEALSTHKDRSGLPVADQMKGAEDRWAIERAPLGSDQLPNGNQGVGAGGDGACRQSGSQQELVQIGAGSIHQDQALGGVAARGFHRRTCQNCLGGKGPEPPCRWPVCPANILSM